MEFYFDIKFINELQKSTDDSDIYFDFKRFVKQICGKIFFISDTEINLEALNDNIWLRYIIDAVTPEFITFKELNSQIESDSVSGFKCFFTNQIESVSLRQNFGYFAINSFELPDYSKYFDSSRQDLKKVTSDRNGANFLNSWGVLSEFKHPINSVIINDRYLFASEKNLDINILDLLSKLELAPLKRRKVDILFITEKIFENSKTSDSMTISDKNEKFERLFSILNKHLINLLGIDGFNLTLIKVNENTVPRASNLHFRICFTNCLVINSEPSFSFFEKKGSEIKSRVNEDVNFDFLFWRRAIIPLNEKLNNIKKAFIDVPERMQAGSIAMPKDFQQRYVISNNKKCRILI